MGRAPLRTACTDLVAAGGVGGEDAGEAGEVEVGCGKGGYAWADLTVSPGQTLRVLVDRQGRGGQRAGLGRRRLHHAECADRARQGYHHLVACARATTHLPIVPRSSIDGDSGRVLNAENAVSPYQGMAPAVCSRVTSTATAPLTSPPRAMTKAARSPSSCSGPGGPDPLGITAIGEERQPHGGHPWRYYVRTFTLWSPASRSARNALA